MSRSAGATSPGAPEQGTGAGPSVCAMRRGRSGCRALCLVCLLPPLAGFAGCHTPFTACDRPCVSAKLEARMGLPLGPCPPPGQVLWPAGASLEDGLTEEEAVAIALW